MTELLIGMVIGVLIGWGIMHFTEVLFERHQS